MSLWYHNRNLSDHHAKCFDQFLEDDPFKDIPNYSVSEMVEFFGPLRSVFPIVFAIDEGHVLLRCNSSFNVFLAWRHFLIEINSALPVVGAITSTNSRISNFVPSTRYDPSARAIHGIRLFHPMTRTLMDIFLDPSTKTSTKYEEFGNGSRDEAKKSYLLGRPLWKSVNEDLEGLLNFAEAKLLRCQDDNELAFTSSLFAARTSMAITNFQLATDIVANGMAVLTSVSANRQTIMCRYVGEPILQDAARRKMKSPTDPSVYEKSLDNLYEVFFTNQVDAGAIGEIVAEILLLDAFDRAQDLKYDQKIDDPSCWKYELAVTVEEFLHQLCPDRAGEILSRMEARLKTGKILFSKFHQINCLTKQMKLFTMDTIEEFLIHRCAFSFRKSFPGIDQAIPVVLEPLETDEKPVYTLLMISVKNKEKRVPTSYLDTLNRQLEPGDDSSIHLLIKQLESVPKYTLILDLAHGQPRLSDYQPYLAEKLTIVTWNDLKIPDLLNAKYKMLFSCDDSVEIDVALRMEATGMLRTKDIDIDRLLQFKQIDSLCSPGPKKELNLQDELSAYRKFFDESLDPKAAQKERRKKKKRKKLLLLRHPSRPHKYLT